MTKRSIASWAKSIPGTCRTSGGRPPRSSRRCIAGEGLDAVEIFHPDHGPGEEERFGGLARDLGLATTAGSDFHGSVEGKKFPGGVFGDARMLEPLRARIPRR